MKLTLAEISSLVQGTVHGDDTVIIEDAAGISEARSKDISFIKDAKNESLIESTQAGAILVPKGISTNGKNLISVENPLAAFAIVLHHFSQDRTFTPEGIHSSSVVSPKATIGRDVKIGPLCVIEDDAKIDDGAVLMGQNYVGHHSHIAAKTKLYPQVVIRERVTVGSQCIIHSGTVIGSDGFGYYFTQNRHNKIPQIGTVIIEDNVEIGSGTTIDRATTGTTRIGRGSKIDNLVQIAHNVNIGANSIIVAQVGIAGSTTIEEGVVLAGQVGVADHARIGKGSQVGAQSGVKGNIKPGSILFGSPAQSAPDAMKQFILMKKLPQLFKDVKTLKEKKEK